MRDRRPVEELSLAELEQLLLTRRREERMLRLRERGVERELPEPVAPLPERAAVRLPRFAARRARPVAGGAPPSWKARLLTLVEVAALVGFLVAGVLWYLEARATDLAVPPSPQASAAGAENAAPLPAGELPGNPAPPTDDTPVPALYQEWVQPAGAPGGALLGELSESRPVRIVIPKLGVDAPVVEGVDWEALKRGAGHMPGTALPGQRGNMVISAHNDIFGELFRYLEQLEPGDEFAVWDAQGREYRYVVRTKRIVEPSEVGVLADSPEPLATLITCHPYLIDSHRLVVQAEFVP